MDGGGCLQEIESGGVCGEDEETFTEDPFEFRKARIVGGDEGAEVGVVGGLSGLDGLRVEGTENLFANCKSSNLVYQLQCKKCVKKKERVRHLPGYCP